MCVRDILPCIPVKNKIAIRFARSPGETRPFRINNSLPPSFSLPDKSAGEERGEGKEEDTELEK